MFKIRDSSNMTLFFFIAGSAEWHKRTERALTDAQKDNDFIYHERVPDVKALAALGRACVVKTTEVADKFMPTERELFAKLMPVHIHQVSIGKVAVSPIPRSNLLIQRLDISWKSSKYAKTRISESGL